jgi:hypothetical protein
VKALELLDSIGFVLNEEGDCDVRATLNKQAEISFKAGIKEVIEWIKTNNRNNPQPFRGVNISREQWQSKLKECGIE